VDALAGRPGRFFRFLAKGLVAVIGRETEKNYVSAGVERDWTAEEDADFLAFCDRIDEIPSDPELRLAMENGECDFFNNDPFVGVKLYRT
jgi:hypothetical protein